MDRYEIQIYPINRRLQVMNINDISSKNNPVHKYVEEEKIID